MTIAASAPETIADTFREFARRYSQAERMHANARATDRDSDRADTAISLKQAVEQEFERCFVRVKIPDWQRVESAAAGVLEGCG